MKTRKMKALLTSALVLILCILGGCSVPYSNVEGNLLSYAKATENGGHTVNFAPKDFLDYGYTAYDMTKETAQDVADHMEDYTAYWIPFHIRNVSSGAIYMLRAKLAEKSDNLWYDLTSFYKGTLDMDVNAEYEGKLLVIIKTGNKNEQEIDSIVKAMKLEIDWSLTPSSDSLGAFKVISFEGQAGNT